MHFQLPYHSNSSHTKGLFGGVLSWLWQKYKDTTGVTNVSFRLENNLYVMRPDSDMQKALDDCGITREKLNDAWFLWAIRNVECGYTVVMIAWLDKQNRMRKREIFVKVPDNDSAIAVELKLVASSL